VLKHKSLKHSIPAECECMAFLKNMNACVPKKKSVEFALFVRVVFENPSSGQLFHLLDSGCATDGEFVLTGFVLMVGQLCRQVDWQCLSVCSAFCLETD